VGIAVGDGAGLCVGDVVGDAVGEGDGLGALAGTGAVRRTPRAPATAARSSTARISVPSSARGAGRLAA
jgi:hypothetical protein